MFRLRSGTFSRGRVSGFGGLALAHTIPPLSIGGPTSSVIQGWTEEVGQRRACRYDSADRDDDVAEGLALSQPGHGRVGLGKRKHGTDNGVELP
jgi:hypothetical protein